jgi:hypothetical protein
VVYSDIAKNRYLKYLGGLNCEFRAQTLSRASSRYWSNFSLDFHIPIIGYFAFPL